MAELTDEDEEALAAIAWAEARGESRAGQKAIVDVVVNRAFGTSAFPNTPVGVIEEVNSRGVAQFSPMVGLASWSQLPTPPKDFADDMKAHARGRVAGTIPDQTLGATIFSVNGVNLSPRGASITIGNHVFGDTFAGARTKAIEVSNFAGAKAAAEKRSAASRAGPPEKNPIGTYGAASRMAADFAARTERSIDQAKAGVAAKAVASLPRAEVQYDIAGKVRNQMPDPTIVDRVAMAVAAINPTLSVVVSSARQAPKGSGAPHVGSTRHDTGLAVDFAIVDARGNIVPTGAPEHVAVFASLPQFGVTGLGVGMSGSRMHADLTGRTAAWGYQGNVTGSRIMDVNFPEYSRALQAALGVPVDGKFGPASKAALAAVNTRNPLGPPALANAIETAMARATVTGLAFGAGARGTLTLSLEPALTVDRPGLTPASLNTFTTSRPVTTSPGKVTVSFEQKDVAPTSLANLVGSPPANLVEAVQVDRPAPALAAATARAPEPTLGEFAVTLAAPNSRLAEQHALFTDLVDLAAGRPLTGVEPLDTTRRGVVSRAIETIQNAPPHMSVRAALELTLGKEMFGSAKVAGVMAALAPVTGPTVTVGELQQAMAYDPQQAARAAAFEARGGWNSYGLPAAFSTPVGATLTAADFDARTGWDVYDMPAAFSTPVGATLTDAEFEARGGWDAYGMPSANTANTADWSASDFAARGGWDAYDAAAPSSAELSAGRGGWDAYDAAAPSSAQLSAGRGGWDAYDAAAPSSAQLSIDARVASSISFETRGGWDAYDMAAPTSAALSAGRSAGRASSPAAPAASAASAAMPSASDIASFFSGTMAPQQSFPGGSSFPSGPANQSTRGGGYYSAPEAPATAPATPGKGTPGLGGAPNALGTSQPVSIGAWDLPDPRSLEYEQFFTGVYPVAPLAPGKLTPTAVARPPAIVQQRITAPPAVARPVAPSSRGIPAGQISYNYGSGFAAQAQPGISDRAYASAQDSGYGGTPSYNPNTGWAGVVDPSTGTAHTTYNPDTGSTWGFGGGGGGADAAGGDDTVICTYFRDRGRMSQEMFLEKAAYGREHYGAAHFAGYHLWARPIVRAMERGHVWLEAPAWRLVSIWYGVIAGRRSGRPAPAVARVAVLVGESLCLGLGTMRNLVKGDPDAPTSRPGLPAAARGSRLRGVAAVRCARPHDKVSRNEVW